MQGEFPDSDEVTVFRRELHKNVPIVLEIDPQSCGWESSAQTTLVLIVGDCDEGFWCYDIHEGKTPLKILEFKRLKEYYNKNNTIYYVHKVISNEKSDITLDLFVDYMKEHIYPKRETIFFEMKKLADCIRTKLDLSKEMPDTEIFFHMPLFFNLSNILRARLLPSEMLDYIYNVTGEARAHQYAHILKQLGADWKLLWSAFAKLGCWNYDTKDPRYINKMNEVADALEKIAEKELEFITRVCENKIQCSSNLIVCEPNSYLLKPDSTIKRIELNSFYNNRAFAYTADNQEGADISEQRECFYLDANQMHLRGYIYGREFEIPLIHGEMDNISCNGQEIILNGVACRQIIFISCAVWGDIYNSIKILCDDKNELTVMANVSDWYNLANDKKEVWHGNIIDMNGKLSKRSIFGYIYDIGDRIINSILLPNANTLHIFGIYVVN